MCFPALLGIGAVLSGVGSALGAVMQGQQYAAQAKLHERQAILEREKGSFDSAQQTKKIQAGIGEQIAGFASNGVDVSSGSPLSVVKDTGTEGALDVASIRYGARIREDNEKYSAKVAQMNSGMAMASAPFAFLTPILNNSSKIKSAFG